MSQEINIAIKATDEASKTIAEVGKKISKSIDNVEQVSKRLAEQQKKTAASVKNLATSFSGIATGAFNLYNSLGRVDNANRRIEKSKLAVKRATETLNDAQKRHDNVLKEQELLLENVANAQGELERVQTDGASTAEDVEQAQEQLNDALLALDENKDAITSAVKDVEIAEDNLKIKTEEAEDAQNALRDTILGVSLQTVPAIITISDKLTALNNLDFTPLVTKLGVVDTSLKGIAASAGITAGAIGSILGTLYIAETTKEARTYEAIIPPGVPKPPLSPGQTETPFGLPSLDLKKRIRETMGVPGMQFGGIVTEPTIALLGETGPEAVIPIKEIARSSERGGDIHVHLNFEGDIYNMEDFESKVRKAASEGVMEAKRRRS